MVDLLGLYILLLMSSRGKDSVPHRTAVRKHAPQAASPMRCRTGLVNLEAFPTLGGLFASRVPVFASITVHG